MEVKKWSGQSKPPCPKCPYTLGLIHTFMNPCPLCKANDYRIFEQFQKQVSQK